MSGRDGAGGISGGSDDELPCEKLRFEAQLTSPQPTIVSTLSTGSQLDITVVEMKGLLIVQALSNGQIAGGLVGPDASKLRNCIGKGHRYKATVRAINGGQVRVFVEHA